MHDSGLIFLAALVGLFLLQAGLLFLLISNDGGPPLRPSEALALGFGLGVGLVTFQMLLVSLADVPLRVPTLVLPWAVAWAGVLLGARTRLRHLIDMTAHRECVSLPLWQRIATSAVFALLVGLVLLVFYRASLYPIFAWDAWAIWDLKARAFFHDGSIKPFLADGYYGLTHQDYPLLFPLAGTLLYLVLREPHHIVQFIPATFFVCNLIVCTSLLRRLGASGLLALTLTAGFASVPTVLSSALHFKVEAAFIYYALTMTVYLFLYLVEERRLFLLTSALAAGFMTQTRAEGVLVLLAPIALLTLRAALMKKRPERRRALSACMLYSGLAFAVFLPWALSYRFLTVPDGRLISLPYLARLWTSPSGIVDVMVALMQWLTAASSLGPFTLLAALTLLLVALDWNRHLRRWPNLFLLSMVVWSCAPAFGFLTARPEFLQPPTTMGRYLVVATMALFLLFACEMVHLFRTSEVTRRMGTALLVVLATTFALWFGLDLLGRLAPSPTDHARPVETIRDVLTWRRAFAPVTPFERVQKMEAYSGRPYFAEMLEPLLKGTLPNGDIILFRSPGDADAESGGYLCQRLYSLLYPRKVWVVSTLAELEQMMAASLLAAIVVYGQDPPSDRIVGELVYSRDAKFVVVRDPRLRAG